MDFQAKNRRRLDLIHKRYHGGGLDDRETEELARLAAEVAEHVERTTPRSTEVLDEMAARIERLKKAEVKATGATDT